MDGYEQMLEIDRITVEYGVSEEELMQLMASAKGESSEPKLDPISDPSFARSKSVDYDMEPTQSRKIDLKHCKMPTVFVWNTTLANQDVHVNHK